MESRFRNSRQRRAILQRVMDFGGDTMNKPFRKTVTLASLMSLLLAGAAPRLIADDPPQLPPWSAPVDLGSPVNSIQADFQPAISPDGLSLYVVRFCGATDPTCNVNNAIMWVFRRATKQDPWGVPEQLPATINVAGKTKVNPFITADGHWMYFSSNRTGTLGSNDLWRSYRNNMAVDSGPDGWQTPENLGPAVNTSGQEQMGCVFTEEGTGTTTLIFNSDRAHHPDTSGEGAIGGFGHDIYASTLQADGAFSPAVPVVELNDLSAMQQQPTCSRDGLEMYFISDRPGSTLDTRTGRLSLDIWVSTRASTSDPWGPPENLDVVNARLGGPPINSPFHDGRPALLADGTELYFFSAEFRPGTLVPPFFDIWVTTRPDTTPPNPPTPHVEPPPNSEDWNNTNVVVSFTSNGDPGHIATGVSGCTADVSLGEETSGTAVNGTCTDRAGNASAPTSVTIKIDKTAPSVTVTGVTNRATYLLGNVPTPGCSSSDNLSGVATPTSLTVTGGTANGVGAFIATCSGAADVAGNTSLPVAAVYTVVYTFTGFQSPLSSSAFSGDFKLGSTVPVKWQLRDSAGAFIGNLSAVESLQIVFSGDCSGEAAGSAMDLGASGATGLRYDTTSNQFIFNWQTKGLAAGCYRILLRLDDTTLHSTMVSLR